jgi:hypothetical protein
MDKILTDVTTILKESDDLFSAENDYLFYLQRFGPSLLSNTSEVGIDDFPFVRICSTSVHHLSGYFTFC